MEKNFGLMYDESEAEAFAAIGIFPAKHFKNKALITLDKKSILKKFCINKN